MNLIKFAGTLGGGIRRFGMRNGWFQRGEQLSQRSAGTAHVSIPIVEKKQLRILRCSGHFIVEIDVILLVLKCVLRRQRSI